MSKNRNDRASVERRQKEANIRKEKYDALSPQERIKELDNCNFVAKKQRAKILKSTK